MKKLNGSVQQRQNRDPETRITQEENRLYDGCAGVDRKIETDSRYEQVTLTTNGVLLKAAAGSESCGTGYGEYQCGRSGPGELSEKDHRTDPTQQ